MFRMQSLGLAAFLVLRLTLTSRTMTLNHKEYFFYLLSNNNAAELDATLLRVCLERNQLPFSSYCTDTGAFKEMS